MAESAQAARINLSISAGVASLEIHNPDKRNALTKAMCIELQQILPRLDVDPKVIVITLRGAGSTFSAGAAIGELDSVLIDQQDDGRRIDHLSGADEAIAAASKPTIALVDGACMGGGWQIASACDFIIASDRSVFAITPAKLGVIYPRAGVERLIRQVGEARAKYILFSAETYSAARAQGLGLIAEAVTDEAFETRCVNLVASIRDNSQFSIHTLKRLAGLAVTDSRSDVAWNRAWSDMIDAPDMGIGIAAFQNRVLPRFAWVPQSRERRTQSP